MPSVLDIAPPELTCEELSITRQKGGEPVVTLLELRGVKMREMVGLITRFPALAKRMSGVDTPDSEMLAEGLDLMPAVIAAGLGRVGEKDVEEAISNNLTDQEQQQAFAIVMRLTAPAPGTTPAPLSNGQVGGELAPSGEALATS